QPIQKMVPPVRCICKALGAHLAAAGDAHVERILGNVDTQYSVGHCLILPSRLCGTSSASSNLVRRIYALARPRIPSSLNSGAWKNGASSTAQAHSPKGRKRLTVLLAAQQTCLFTKQPATYKGRSLPTAPRTEPRERNSRTRLPPWVCDGKAHLRPRMKGCWLREIVGCDLRDPLPRRAILLAAAL